MTKEQHITQAEKALLKAQGLAESRADVPALLKIAEAWQVLASQASDSTDTMEDQ